MVVLSKLILNWNEFDFQAPYYGPGLKNCTFPNSQYRNMPGVYVIRIYEKIMYVGRAKTSLYKAAYRHFTEYCKTKKVFRKYTDTFYDRFTQGLEMAFIETNNPEVDEVFWINYFQPVDNRYYKQLTMTYTKRNENTPSAFGDDYDIIQQYDQQYDADDN